MSKYPFFPDQFRDELINRHNEGHRHYHDLNHLTDLWAKHLENGGSEDDSIIKYAIAYHDCVYDPRAGQNEARSNEVWLDHAAQLNLSAQMIAAVSACILATAQHPISTQPAEFPDYVQWFCDLDLTPLAATPDKFRSNAFDIHQEYAFVGEQEFVAGRKAFYEAMLAAPQLYLTPDLHAKYEDAARTNIKWALWGMERGLTV